MATLAESFLADLEDLSDASDQPDQPEEQDDVDDDINVCCCGTLLVCIYDSLMPFSQNTFDRRHHTDAGRRPGRP